LAKHIPLKRSVAAVALTLTAPHLVFAQGVDASTTTAKPIERVVITGSNIKRLDVETATPVQIVRREDISRLGVNNVRQLIDTLTASDQTSLDDIGGSSSFASGASSASLRNLGKQSTLVLLNSRRVAPYALADYNEVFTNLDALPIDAVERIEVLRSGGSAIYGSDAVAGVINIITRGDYRGIEASASHEQSVKDSGFSESKASITAGFGNLDNDRYNILANVEVFKRENLFWRDVVDDINPIYGQRFSAVAAGSGGVFGGRGAPSTFSFPGNLIGQGPLPGCTTLSAAGLCVYDRFSRFEVQPEAERVNTLVSGRYKFRDNLEGFAEVLYSNTKTIYRSTFATFDSAGGITSWGDPRTGGSRTFEYGPLPATHPFNTSGVPRNLRYRFLDDPSISDVDSSQYRVLAGLRGDYNGWDWESALGVMGSKTTDRSRGRGFWSIQGFTNVIGTPGLDENGNVRDPLLFQRGYQLGQINSPQIIDQLFPESGYDGRITQQFVDFRASGEIGNWGGRPVLLAFGGDARHEKFEINPTANLLAGDILSNGAATANASRNIFAAFAEVEVPFTTKLTGTGAVRVDKYGDFEAHWSPKLALRFEATPSLLFRATAETGFRAPNLTESAQSSKFAFSNGVVDPRRCPQAQRYADDLRATAEGLATTDPNRALYEAKADAVTSRECAAGVASIVLNNPDLEPETSKSGTIGVVFEPVAGYNVSLDYWNIKRKDEIGIKSTDELLAAEADQPPGTIRRLAGSEPSFTDVNGGNAAAIRAQYGVTADPLQAVSGRFLNVAQTRTSGVDLSATARIPTRIGRVNLGLYGTYLIKYEQFYTERGQGGGWGINRAGGYAYSRWRTNLMASLETGKFTNMLRFVWNSPTSLQQEYFDEGSFDAAGCEDLGWSSGECRISSYVRTDWSLTWAPDKNLTISGYVRNVFNRRPPLDLRGMLENGGGVIPQDREDVRGRVIRLAVNYKFR
jgi:iron complex outermembrane receptor protein